MSSDPWLEFHELQPLSADQERLIWLGIRIGRDLAYSRLEASVVPTDHDEFTADWQHGICQCNGCAGIIQVVPRLRQTPKVVDADGREHYCERHIAATLQRHGVPGMDPILRRHAERRPIVDPKQPPPENYGAAPRGL